MKVVCVGEILIDFVCLEKGCELSQGREFARMPGGAPANVAACVGRLGGQSEFVGAIGKDSFGEFLVETLAAYQVGTSHLYRTEVSTTLAFVSRKQDGDRDFEFFRGADEQLCLDGQQRDAILNDAILHLGSATALLGGELYKTYMQLAVDAKSKGRIVSFDPNYRLDLWKGKEQSFRERCEPLFALADIAKVSEEELALLSGTSSLELGCKHLHELGAEVILVTMGRQGCLVSFSENQVQVPAYDIDAVDTTGAGDAFIGAVLFRIASLSPEQDYRSMLVEIVRFAEKVSAKVCTQIGAMSALPTLQEVEKVNFLPLAFSDQ